MRYKYKAVFKKTRNFRGKRYTYAGSGFSKGETNKMRKIFKKRFFVRAVKKKTQFLGKEWEVWIRNRPGVKSTLTK